MLILFLAVYFIGVVLFVFGKAVFFPEYDIDGHWDLEEVAMTATYAFCWPIVLLIGACASVYYLGLLTRELLELHQPKNPSEEPCSK